MPNKAVLLLQADRLDLFRFKSQPFLKQVNRLYPTGLDCRMGAILRQGWVEVIANNISVDDRGFSLGDRPIVFGIWQS